MQKMQNKMFSIKSRFSRSYVIATIVIFAIIGTLVACKKTANERATLSAHDKELIVMFSKVGEIHNKGLDVLYAKLVEKTKNKTKTTNSVKNMFVGPEYGDNQIPLGDINSMSFNYLQSISQIQGITNFVPFYNGDLLPSDPAVSYATSLSDHAYQATGTVPSNELQYALAQLESLYKDDNTSQQSYLYDNLVTSMVPVLTTDNDKAIFIGAVSVAQHSTQYWSGGTNLIQWNALAEAITGVPNTITLNSMKDVAYADIAGAVIGGVAGAKVGLVGGTVAIPGIGTAVGGAAGVLVGLIGGAITGSAAEGIHSAIKWLIGW